jgi:cell division protein FtsW
VDFKGLIDTRRKGRPDMGLFFAVLILAGFGLAMVYSASAVMAFRNYGSSFYFFKKQLIWFIVGFGFLILMQEIDYRKFTRFTLPMLIGSVFLLCLVFIPGIGHSAKGSARWIALGGQTIQPSEFVKIVMVIYLVKVFSAEPRHNASQVLQFLIPMLVLGGMFILILMQPDFGTAIDILIVSVAILFASGFPIIYMAVLAILSVPAFYLFIYQAKYRWERILSYADPWHDRFGIGYHIIQAFTAFKKGGILGAGLGFGVMKVARLPEPHTDFIFAVIAEETGYFGTAGVVLLFLFFFWRGMKIAFDAPDSYGKLLASGLTLMVTVQAFINIGVVTGALPTTGIPLPFISYGGSSFLSCMISSGILLNISRYRETVHEGFTSAVIESEEVM